MSSLSMSENCDNCVKAECDGLSADQLFCKYGNAVVRVQSEFILVGPVVNQGGERTPPKLTSATPLSDPISAGTTTTFTGGRRDVIINGNGFFIKGHKNERYIVCPASLVLLPPALTGAVARYPYVPFNSGDIAALLPNGNIRDDMTRASRIIVDVFNVNTKGRDLSQALSYSYKAELIGVDGAADIAVLRIDREDPYNLSNPCITDCHPYLCFTDKAYECQRTPMVRGQKVYLLGDYLQALTRNKNSDIIPTHGTRTSMGITEGLLAHHRHADHTGFALQELVLVSGANIGPGAVGLPILNSQGFVIGMQTLNPSSIQENTGNILDLAPQNTVTGVLMPGEYDFENNPAMAAGPGTIDLVRVIKLLTKRECARCPTNCSPLQEIEDSVGSYFRVRKGFAGISSDLFIGSMYGYTMDLGGTFSAGRFGGLPRIILDDNGQLVNGPTNKQIVGVRVLAQSGPNPTSVTTPTTTMYHVGNFKASTIIGTSTIISSGFDSPSPFASKIKVGDVIYAIEGKFIGDIAEQIVPTLITWIAGLNRVTLEFRRGVAAANGAAITSPILENKNKAVASLAEFPKGLDYPFYATSLWPRLPSFYAAYAPALDSTLQLPQGSLADTNTVPRFRPAW